MSKVCQVTGKKPQAGNNVSHAKNRNKRTFQPNLHKHRFWVESEKRYVTLTVSANGMRTIDKKKQAPSGRDIPEGGQARSQSAGGGLRTYKLFVNFPATETDNCRQILRTY